ncbi:MAG: AAA family ATPase [Chloroflexi bacterium]|nr:AAA family ATPase [Chloroflexota bacterium]
MPTCGKQASIAGYLSDPAKFQLSQAGTPVVPGGIIVTMAEIADLVRAMAQPGFYPHHPASVEVVQTQMSVVFLTGEYVYKIKKPVNLGYLDYTTLERRRHACEQEAVLNRRLCPEVYLGVIPVTFSGGKYTLNGQGDTVEYAVKMKQLPRDRTLDVLLRENKATPDMLAGLARKIADFHRQAVTGPAIASFGSLPMIANNVEENFSQTERYAGITVSRRHWERLRSYSRSFLGRNSGLFGRRVSAGRIRDCHGDLHSAHVCFTNGLCIFDCIEFNDRFRYGDVASELAFLAMDIDYFERADLSSHLVNAYVVASGDRQLLELLDFYRCYRALVRAKVNCFKLDDPLVPEPEKKTAADTARRYFALARSYTMVHQQPVLIATMGLVGTGKTALAQAVAQVTGAEVISSDVTRKQLLNVPLTGGRFEEYDSGLYSSAMNRKTYDEMFARTRTLLKAGKPVILDASFRRLSERETARAVARDKKARFLLVECRAPEELVKERLARRLREGSVSDGRWEIYEKQKTDTDPVSELAPTEHVILDTAQSLPELTNTVLNRWGWWEEGEK